VTATAAAFIAIIVAAASARPPTVDVCSLWSQPDFYRGRLVRVRADVEPGLETEALQTPGCERVALVMGGPTLASGRNPRSLPPAGSRVFVADASLDEFLATRGDPAGIPAAAWRELVEVPLEKDGQWKHFEAAVWKGEGMRGDIPCAGCWYYSVTATLEGYFDFIPEGRGRVERGQDGGLRYFGGFGHMNMFRGQFVVTRVLAFRASKR
jgi:hypothetical protein